MIMSLIITILTICAIVYMAEIVLSEVGGVLPRRLISIIIILCILGYMSRYQWHMWGAPL